MEWIGSVFSTVINGGWKLYLAVLIASSALLFLPDTTIAQLGLEEVRHTYRTQIGVAFVLSASLIAARLISVLWDILLSPWYHWRFNRVIFKTLTELTLAEKSFLAPFITAGQNTQYAEMYDGVAKGLEAKKILYRSSNISAPGGAFPYNLQSYARKMLVDHPSLLAP
jgi:hypothetical protein